MSLIDIRIVKYLGKGHERKSTSSLCREKQFDDEGCQDYSPSKKWVVLHVEQPIFFMLSGFLQYFFAKSEV